MNDNLNIAVLATSSLPIPPFHGYGGTQRGIYDFLVQMNKKGHELHLFGPGDSKVSHLKNVVLHSYFDNSMWTPENNSSIEVKREQSQYHYDKSLEEISIIDENNPFDIINIRTDNLDVLEKVVEKFGNERIVYSLHNVRNENRIEAMKKLKVMGIAHCNNHKKQHKNIENIKVITYGIDVESYPFSGETLTKYSGNLSLDILKELKERKKDYLINLGGIAKHKGQKTSIELAKSVHIPIILAGTPQDRTSNEKQDYFDTHIKPYIDGENVLYFGNANEEQKKELLKFAKGFIFPSGFEDKTWNEPFGRAPVEALSCGTPVIAYRKGSMNEIIYERFNGYLFDTLKSASDKINKLDSIKRANCRLSAETLFDSKRVADEYETLFYNLKKQNSNN